MTFAVFTQTEGIKTRDEGNYLSSAAAVVKTFYLRL